MQYLTQTTEIRTQIAKFPSAKTLWVDTEIADWDTYYPKLSLIQVLAEPTNLTSDSAYILDVLNQPELAADFINQIIVNPQIEKVFHNASFDLKYLGGKQAPNITCTLKLARKITREVLQVSNLQLKTLATELCQFSDVDKEEQGSDWGKRPLTQKQLNYAAMDTVYLAAVHRRLLEISNPNAVSSIFDMVANGSKKSTKKSEQLSLSATKVRVAFECPRLFYLNQRFGGNTLFLPPENPLGIGNTFHQLANDFVRLLAEDPRFVDFLKSTTPQSQIEETASRLQEIFYEIKFYSYLQAAIKKDSSQAQALFKVWQGLQGLIKRFAELLVVNRGYCDAETVIHKTFVTQERKLEYHFNLPDNTQQRVAGEFDCIVYNFEKKRLCVRANASCQQEPLNVNKPETNRINPPLLTIF